MAEAGDAGTPFVASPGEASKEVRKLAEAVIEEGTTRERGRFFSKRIFCIYIYIEREREEWDGIS